jgi:thioredoxin reductase
MVADIIVVGGGPAGLSAATWAARYRRTVLVIDNGEPRNRWADVSHGFLGRDPAVPSELLRDAVHQLEQYPSVTVLHGEVTDICRDDFGRFVVRVGDDVRVGLRVVLATGITDRFPAIGGFFEHYGASVFHCATCDGYEARGRAVVVLGWAAHVSGFASDLLDWAATVTVVTDGRSFEGEAEHRAALERHGVGVVDEEALELLGARGSLEGVRLRSGAVLPAEYLFFSISHHPRLGLARRLGCEETVEGCLVVDRDGRTSVAGCYAAGDVTPGVQLVPVAVGEGAAAGVACARSLQGERGAPGSPTPAPDLDPELVAER